ncbi:MAG: hypothetical protein KDD39_03410 [Bdellovibrionales bacterium]|nr:hypothetical protein [Bdellovibrionales bacterium]
MIRQLLALSCMGLTVLATASELSVETEAFGPKAVLTVSSALKPARKIQYGPENLIDGNPKTAWIEGAKDVGVGETLSIQFEKPVEIYGIRFIPGYAKTVTHLSGNALPEFTLSIGEKSYQVGRGILEHTIATVKKGKLTGEPYRVPTGRAENLQTRYVWFPEKQKSDKLVLTLTGALSTVGVEPDNGFSEFAVLTEASIEKDPIAKVLMELADEKEVKRDVKVVTPETEGRCPRKIKAQADAEIAKLTASAIVAKLREHMLGTPLREGAVLLNPVFTRDLNGSTLVTGDASIVDTCYSDGEGGVQFVPQIKIDKNRIVEAGVSPRLWPVF